MVDNSGKDQHRQTEPSKDQQTEMTSLHKGRSGIEQVIHGKNSFESFKKGGKQRLGRSESRTARAPVSLLLEEDDTEETAKIVGSDRGSGPRPVAAKETSK